MVPGVLSGDLDDAVAFFVEGWNAIEGVLALTPEPRYAVAWRALIAASNERALRGLLLAAPRGGAILFAVAGAWPLPTLAELFDGREVTPRPPFDCAEVRLYLGIRRGSGMKPALDDDALFRGPPLARAGPPPPVADAALHGTKDPIVARLRDLGGAAGRRARGQFLAEGLLLAVRALDDLPVQDLFYTAELQRDPAGVAILRRAADLGVPAYRISDGLMGLITPTRPIPPVMTAIWGRVRDVAEYRPGPRALILVTENLNNPENLGMTLRTADAAGVEAVVIAGSGADPLHRECVRAARGAVGRIPIYACADLPQWIAHLRVAGVAVIGATGNVEHTLYNADLSLPLAVVVGNETDGLSEATLAACSALARIPMAPGQDSLNVGVAAGILLYEVVRRERYAAGSSATVHAPA